MDYQIPTGVHAIPEHLLDLRTDGEVDADLVNPPPVTSEKNIWFFWHQGFANMHHYTQRNVRTWHRRFSKQGWTVRVIDRLPGSLLNVSNFLDETDPNTFPQAFIDGRIGGDYALQHTSDLVRLPLLLRYGGVYADVGMIQIGDLDGLWDKTIGNPDSPYEVLSYNAGGDDEYALTNYFLASRANNALFTRCHRLFLALWAEGGGKTNTEGMHKSGLLKGLRLMGGSFEIEENGNRISADRTSQMLTDYIAQGQTLTMVMSSVDPEDDWDGPKYTVNHIYAIDYMVGSQLINEYTDWSGSRAFELMSQRLPKRGEAETADQRTAREIVEACLQRSFGFKLAHGLILRVLGETLGSLWRKHDGSDVVPGTYADWLRYGTLHWCQDQLPTPVKYKLLKPVKCGPLLAEQL
ncbi:hypothetical protein M433DRAFT_153857 [Acidomyces richmondensis BFW]|nr:MAG: hypothetical protein FE78DRAFT_89739 [Acidomyces sp. 'richmondensis']KYG46036.1 hypothetical protein M433DRAFT_153857 [Acidomyces richmondensis BFW]